MNEKKEKSPKGQMEMAMSREGEGVTCLRRMELVAAAFQGVTFVRRAARVQRSSMKNPPNHPGVGLVMVVCEWYR